MARGTLRLPTTEEQKQAKKIARIMTEDFSVDLDLLGSWIVRDFPVIIFRRFEVVYLSAKYEYDKLMGVESEYDDIFFG